MERIAVFFAEGYEEIEALTVVDILRRAQIDVVMTSITSDRQVTGSHGITVEMDSLFDELDFESIDMIVLPGGLGGTKLLEAFPPLMKQVASFCEKGKWIAAICAAPSILGHRGYLVGRKACSYPTFESHLEGATVCTDQGAVTDGNIITGRGMGCSIDFALEILTKLRGEQIAGQMAENIVYRN